MNNEDFVCSAVIVSKYKILTSASCVYKKYSVRLKFGILKLSDRYFSINVSKEEIFVHPQFSVDIPYTNNIAVIQLKTALNFDEKIGQIEMVDEDYNLGKGITITALGYVYTKEDGNHLRNVDSTMTNYTGCKHDYWSKNNNLLLKEDKQMCFRLDDDKKNTIEHFKGGTIFELNVPQFNI